VGTPFPDIALPLDVDESALRSFLGDLAEGYDRTALPLRSVVMTETAVLSASGVLTASCSPGGEVIAFSEPRSGRRLNVDASVPLVVPVLRRWSRDGGPIELVVEQVAPPPTDLTLLQRVLREQVEDMPGVVGVYVRDLSSGEQVGVNDRVSFSTASAIKIAIMLQAYRVLNEPLDGAAASQMWAMMVDSDNDAANHLLAVGGLGNEETGARLMTWMLHLIGLGDTFMCIGFDGEDCPEAAPPDGWLVDDSGQDRGDPLTSLDPFRQTTARDMGLLMTRLHECSLGQGPILEHFPGQITPEECQAMLGLMEHNADSRRMVAGLPAGVTVAHKTGWITDMKTDVGIVFSPGGAYVLSVFVWQEGELLDSEANSRIASLSWITYAFFNPLGTAQGPDGAATAGGSPTD
jgi:beta-lactamase class A